MNILMLTESNFPFDIRVNREAFKLKKHGHEVSVIAIKDNDQSYYEVIDGVKIYRVPKLELFKSGKQLNSQNVSSRTKFLILIEAIIGYSFEYLYFTLVAFILSFLILIKDKFDVIHTHNPPDTLFIIALFFKIFGKKFVYDHHDLSPELFLEKYKWGNRLVYNLLLFLEKISCKVADKVITTNESYKEIEVQRNGVHPKDIYVVRYGPDLKEMKVTEPIQEIKTMRKTVLCYLGAINIQDGLDYLLLVMYKIVHKHNYRDVLLLVIGQGDYFENIKFMAKELELSDHILFTGRIEDRRVLNRYLSTADIFVDAAPFSVLNDNSTFIKHSEYMIYEKPVVSFALKESMATLQHAGVFVPPNDTDKMAECIIKLINNYQMRNKLSAGARERIKELEWEKVSIPLIRAYESLK